MMVEIEVAGAHISRTLSAAYVVVDVLIKGCGKIAAAVACVDAGQLDRSVS